VEARGQKAWLPEFEKTAEPEKRLVERNVCKITKFSHLVNFIIFR
jgi:hypothetical protein